MREETKLFVIAAIVSLVMVGIVSFWAGRLTVKPVIKTVTQEVKVYDFTQSPHIIEAYANTIGKTLADKNEIDNGKKEIEFMRHKIFQDGYIAGVQAKRQ